MSAGEPVPSPHGSTPQGVQRVRGGRLRAPAENDPLPRRFLQGSALHVEYRSLPPGFTSRAASHRIRYCKSGRLSRSVFLRYRISGFLRIMPSPEQGASHRTLSAGISGFWGCSASRTCAFTMVSPSRVAPSAISLTFPRYLSKARSSPSFCISSAMVKDLPPGAAHTSITRAPPPLHPTAVQQTGKRDPVHETILPGRRQVKEAIPSF